MNEPLASQNSDPETGMPPEHLSAGDLQPGTVISGFRIERKIGRGGMGVVYLAMQLNLQRYAALKILADELSGDSMFVERFFQEAHSAACLSHSNIVQAYDAGVSSGLCYFAMEFVDGETLDVLLQREGAQPAASVMNIGYQIACALDHAWRTHGMCHGDIKPDNILIGWNGELKLADLGLAKSIYDEDIPQDVMVTPLYAAPEIISGKVKEPNLLSDIYSFGALLYHAAAGTPPFNSEAIEEIYRRHLEEIPRPPSFLNPELPEALSSLILRMLEKNPENRPSSWEEIKEAFQNMLEEPQAEEPEKPQKKTFGNLCLISFILLLLAIAGIAWFVRIAVGVRDSLTIRRHAVSRKSDPKPSAAPSPGKAELPRKSAVRDQKTEMLDKKNAEAYLRIAESFCFMTRFAPCFGIAETENMRRICRFLILQGKLPHLAEIRGKTESNLEIAQQILAARSKSFRTYPNSVRAKSFRTYPHSAEKNNYADPDGGRTVSKKKTVRQKRKVIPKKIDHNALLLRILTEYHSNPQQCREKLEAFSRKYRKTAVLQSKQARWIAEAMTPPDELHSLFLPWNLSLKGLPMRDFGTSCEFFEMNRDFMYLQFRKGSMRLRQKYPSSPVNMQKLQKALMRAAYRFDFRNRFPEEIQRYTVISLLLENPAAGKTILRNLYPRMQKELVPIRTLIEKSAKQ